MQITEPRIAGSEAIEVDVTPSLAVDLSWAAYGASAPKWRAKHPEVGVLYDADPSLRSRVVQFWGPPHGAAAVQIWAWHAGALGVTEGDELWNALEASGDSLPTDLALRTEPAEDRSLLREQLAQLHESPRLRQSYLTLLKDLFGAMAALWPAGRAAAAQAGENFGRELSLSRTRSWADLIEVNCTETVELIEQLGLDAFPHVTIAPSSLFGSGMFLELPGTLLVGLDAPQGAVAARARTSALAGRLKTLADPTRLALLHHLATGPRAVGDLAREFGLSQPTVSAHVKQLREAGLVHAARRGNRLELTVARDAMDSLFDELRAVTP